MRTYSVSQVATIVGENPYEEPCNIFEQYWKRENKESYFRALKRLNPEKSFQKNQNELYSALKLDETKEIINTCRTKDNITDTVNHVENVKTTLSENSEKLVKKHIKSSFSTQHGTKSEKGTLDMYNSKTKQNAKPYNIIMNKSYETFNLRGKIDGLIENENTKKIVEIKNRTKRLFYSVRMYEMIQVQLYMNILNSSTADLVEHYNGSLNICNIDYDHDLVTNVINRIHIFDSNLNKIFDDKEFQADYFSSDYRSLFILQENS